MKRYAVTKLPRIQNGGVLSFCGGILLNSKLFSKIRSRFRLSSHFFAHGVDPTMGGEGDEDDEDDEKQEEEEEEEKEDAEGDSLVAAEEEEEEEVMGDVKRDGCCWL